MSSTAPTFIDLLPPCFPASERPDLLAPSVVPALAAIPEALVFAVDSNLAETAALSDAIGLPLSVSANCVVVTGRRGEIERHAACVALATTRVDVNTVVRKRLDARKASFASMDYAVGASGMEYGGITPIGVPPEWPVWIDAAVHETPWVVIGSGVRHSDLVVPGASLARLAGAEVIEGLARPVA